MPKILVVDDEPKIVKIARDYLERAGFRVVTASDGPAVLPAVRAEKPDLVVLDLALPGQDGLDVTRALRRESDVPVIMLTARADEADRLIGLELGADDYITKPFSTIEFTARIRANLRRAQAAQLAAQVQPMSIGDLLVDMNARTLRRGDASIHLTPIEWELLRTFVTQAGRTLTHQQLFNAVWGRAFGDPQQYLRVHVANLRRKIEQDAVRPQLIVTEPGVGYRFEMPR